MSDFITDHASPTGSCEGDREKEQLRRLAACWDSFTVAAVRPSHRYRGELQHRIALFVGHVSSATLPRDA